ncbi:SGNH/GDSL hydrolase family protein [Bacteroides ovatus]|mgnify:CR=1 FL=1|uniref:Uncharacterized protein n=1 Tax=Bacteroides ovatus TaxID=28116 RepID=A0A1G8CNL7_BACOV|nr:SGNH/GDSL hydrolase family protein [Bacteroides ovatus]SDH47137.1 hypothetical protein SAMN05192582_100676 [Bacteroides ovatus]
MKQFLIYIILFLLPSFGSCQNDDWKDEADALKKEIDNQKEIIKNLKQQQVTVVSVKQENGKTVIELSNGKTMEFDRSTSVPEKADNSFPVFTISMNEKWVLNGVETTHNARELDPRKDEDGYWYIGAVQITPVGQSVISGLVEKMNGKVIFYFKDGSEIALSKNSLKRIAAWGDSLTPKYVPYLQKLLGSRYEVLDCGVPGEATTEIAARQGGVPMKLGRDVQLPAKVGEKVEIGEDGAATDGYLQTTYQPALFVPTNNWLQNRNFIRPFRQATKTGDFCTNPCYINGVECRLSKDGEKQDNPGAKCYIERTTDGEAITLPAGSIVYTNAMKNLRHLHVNIFFMGQNGGFSNRGNGKEDVQILIDQYKRMINYSGCDRYVIITFPYRGVKNVGGVDAASDDLKEMERILAEEFGDRLINIREYFSTLDLAAVNVTPIEGDDIRMKNGLCPKALLNNDGKDPIHFNEKGYKLLAQRIYKKFQELGYIVR